MLVITDVNQIHPPNDTSISFGFFLQNGFPVYLMQFMFAGEELHIRRDLKVKAFRTYHRIPSQVIIQKLSLLEISNCSGLFKY